ncbi:peptidase [Sphingomonas sp. RB56-2]|uniref:Peptidase n=1 Tax=Sphingomonas brevis TaxID=2908206 RepID=A0ABT0SAP6_9SPHN|nr:prepilin peptidase [Sphingomonas brevis]MCL6741402.1 peptidase [Sphingomonas brevis]
MRLLVTAPDWLAGLLLLLLVLAAIEDGWRLRISDWISGLVAIGAFAALVLDGPVSGLWQNFLLFAAVLAVGTFMFGRGWMGGGDIKLLAASSLWFDLSDGWKAMVAIAIAGGIETLVIMAVRRLPWPDGARTKALLLKRRGPIPYGIAIALGVALMGWWLRVWNSPFIHF